MFKLKLVTIALLSSVIFAGCSSVQKTQKKSHLAQADTAKSDRVCFKTERIGTHLKTKRCVSRAQAKEEKRAAQKQLRLMTNESSRIKDQG